MQYNKLKNILYRKIRDSFDDIIMIFRLVYENPKTKQNPNIYVINNGQYTREEILKVINKNELEKEYGIGIVVISDSGIFYALDKMKNNKRKEKKDEDN